MCMQLVMGTALCRSFCTPHHTPCRHVIPWNQHLEPAACTAVEDALDWPHVVACRQASEMGRDYSTCSCDLMAELGDACSLITAILVFDLAAP
jgi:hypothetical protein